MGKNDSLFSNSRKLTVDWFREITVPGALTGIPSIRTNAHPGYLRRAVPEETFCTGSTYKGQVDSLGFAGVGTYVYPHGAVYEGYFRDGQFHGEGTITYPNGDYIEGVWVNGKPKNRTFHFHDGLKVEKPWRYCEFPDRRYEDEETRQILDNELPRHNSIKIPPNCYYTGDGYYRPDIGIVYSKNNRVLRVVTKFEEIEIKENFRKEADDHVGYMAKLYEFWTAGRARDIEEIVDKEEAKPSEQRKLSVYASDDQSQSLYSLNFVVN
ncbi:unnamed protein product [Phaedon cochleariae]|uniref:MORN repeat-containing protein 5 n=1 Tax=Phaedon cochleariae TaxID=80249 RepID=A0A9N9SAH4_PHACE|nr:unnamed protein product [Phaedon cochleariae]